MSTSIKVVKWKAVGLRCPDHVVELSREANETWPISLIQMPNGTGKTTTLNLLRGVLSGAFEDSIEWPVQRVRQLQKKEATEDHGEFTVELLVDGRRLTIEAAFDFGEGVVAYRTSYGSGQSEGFSPPRVVRRFLRSGFVNFFAFDGELAEQLLSHDHTDAERAIDDLFQLKLFAEMERSIDSYWDWQTENKTARQERGLSRRRSRVGWLRQRIEELRRERSDRQQEIDELAAELVKVRAQFAHRINSMRERADNVRDKERQYLGLAQHAESLTEGLLVRIRSPISLSHVFADRVLVLKDGLDRVKLPESAAREFFEELSRETLCICGRDFDDETRKAVRERAAEYLGSDEISLLNAMKSDISQRVNKATTQESNGQFRQELTELKGVIRGRHQAKNELEFAIQAVAEDDPAIASAQERIADLEGKLAIATEELRRYDDVDDRFKDENTFGIPVLERRLEDAERKLAEVAQTIELKSKRDALHSILELAQRHARHRLTQEVVDEANVKINELMPYNDIRIQGIRRCLTLRGQEGGSVGETLCVAYAFLSTLFAKTKHDLPFVVDSPAGAIDIRVRQQVAELVPRLSSQFVAFTISTEREGFLDALENSAGPNIQYVTLFRDSVDNAGAPLDSASDVHRTADGVLAYGRSFFRGFHVDEEHQ